MKIIYKNLVIIWKYYYIRLLDSKYYGLINKNIKKNTTYEYY